MGDELVVGGADENAQVHSLAIRVKLVGHYLADLQAAEEDRRARGQGTQIGTAQAELPARRIQLDDRGRLQRGKGSLRLGGFAHTDPDKGAGQHGAEP
ncbi:hypothetical protein D3C77_539560 [compost metagenome]